MTPSPVPHPSSVPTERTFVLDVIPRARYACSHCTGIGTTADGSLWRASLTTNGLFYLHARCLTPYKTTHDLRSVEGRLPRTAARR